MRRLIHRLRWGHWPSTVFMQPELCRLCQVRDYHDRFDGS